MREPGCWEQAGGSLELGSTRGLGGHVCWPGAAARSTRGTTTWSAQSLEILQSKNARKVRDSVASVSRRGKRAVRSSLFQGCGFEVTAPLGGKCPGLPTAQHSWLLRPQEPSSHGQGHPLRGGTSGPGAGRVPTTQGAGYRTQAPGATE